MTCLARLRGCAVAVLSADDEGLMKYFQIRLPWRLVLMAIDASRMHDNARDRVKRRRIGGSGRFAATAGGDREDDHERHEKAHGLSPQPAPRWRSRRDF